jgi:hypothetical protein
MSINMKIPKIFYIGMLIALLILTSGVSAIQYLGAYNSNLSLLMHMNGTDGGTTFTDETGKTITRYTATTITSATISITNTTAGESHSVLTNAAGYYICDTAHSCSLTASRLYSVVGSKTGYGNSSIYHVSVIPS